MFNSIPQQLNLYNDQHYYKFSHRISKPLPVRFHYGEPVIRVSPPLITRQIFNDTKIRLPPRLIQQPRRSRKRLKIFDKPASEYYASSDHYSVKRAIPMNEKYEQNHYGSKPTQRIFQNRSHHSDSRLRRYQQYTPTQYMPTIKISKPVLNIPKPRSSIYSYKSSEQKLTPKQISQSQMQLAQQYSQLKFHVDDESNTIDKPLNKNQRFYDIEQDYRITPRNDLKKTDFQVESPVVVTKLAEPTQKPGFLTKVVSMLEKLDEQAKATTAFLVCFVAIILLYQIIK